ncbi:MAG: hypothetical protein A2268_07695 [Candidatus Raymondbacteria bacterium RifOxyA12_full_50_37]|uniref:Uncharacterized protein n=1 Tax=Candidatus Raymondbacteria bacterium RIFOXYD12_FULL_49_13 TaxID=1817890 RepID=A0A1F7F573_UNCRA|nr:MAG: hypothetical protein A2248_05305 [Candidatus Raymondbacteria bacterium RIFOXYA2_FULL_49_16]OGJ90124.1 MAG: hypothetical protein A2268_07695 [Candidatus Raymondbacteria bacterium RifOxyA12_full_50_37]OGJ92129.1 MAG: hypothetical protein A2350_08655 [Candidatus Raymondbacteria bacterium RifOxyB12_full_50_8]OGJ97702.1 MAG: hypothetical protein A2453_09665 [Candidatus Raymondbacteria bacterium RIFOXYC2_FULL_50_21]OGK01733.1 MAG: hypothetical protein A2519_22950 [Candidatus Raymondbacteria b
MNPFNTKNLTKLKDILSNDYIPFLGGRPIRTQPITHAEIADLKIDLWNAKTVEDFLETLKKP